MATDKATEKGPNRDAELERRVAALEQAVQARDAEIDRLVSQLATMKDQAAAPVRTDVLAPVPVPEEVVGDKRLLQIGEHEQGAHTFKVELKYAPTARVKANSSAEAWEAYRRKTGLRQSANQPKITQEV